MRWLAFLLLAMVAASGQAMTEPLAAKKPGSEAPKAAPKAPEKPAASVVKRFGDWALACREAKDKTKPAPCTLVQQLTDANSKKTVFNLTVGYGPRGNLVLVVRAPLGIALAKGLELSLGGQTLQRAAFSTCRPNGCQALQPAKSCRPLFLPSPRSDPTSLRSEPAPNGRWTAAGTSTARKPGSPTLLGPTL